MRLSKLYSNQSDHFLPITFNAGLNVVMAEIRLPENRAKDTHNLGKTTLGRLLDFCFLKRRDKKLFLFKHQDIFETFVFFLELEIGNGDYVTVRRSIADSSKISFKKHKERDQDFNELRQEDWDHLDLPFARATEMLDSLLGWKALAPWGYRNVLSYLLRTQDDFRDVFHLSKFAGPHGNWKPFLSKLLGFDASLIDRAYAEEAQLQSDKDAESLLTAELGGSIEDMSKIEGISSLKRQEVDRKQALLDSFDFREQDQKKTNELVEEIDGEIAQLNAERYSLRHNQKKIRDSLSEDEIIFDVERARKIFKEAGVLFAGQIKRDFEQLVEFNRSITKERRLYLKEELAEIESRLVTINERLREIGEKRSDALGFLSDTDVFEKYKALSNELVSLRADIKHLDQQKEILARLQSLRAKIRDRSKNLSELTERIENDVEEKNRSAGSQFARIRLYFNEIVEEVVDHKALISANLNSEGHMVFKAEILDDSGNATSADLGNTYRKLLCVAFDLAVLRVHLDDDFPRFVYEDGVLESLDNRKKQNLVAVLRRYADLGLQIIITAIDSDLPAQAEGEEPIFSAEEVVLTLHDEGAKGRLFKLKEW